jgi:hypothetical protein
MFYRNKINVLVQNSKDIILSIEIKYHPTSQTKLNITSCDFGDDFWFKEEFQARKTSFLQEEKVFLSSEVCWYTVCFSIDLKNVSIYAEIHFWRKFAMFRYRSACEE